MACANCGWLKEKFAHITFFLNGGASDPFVGEDDVRIPSPKGVAYDTVPELSLAQVTEQVVEGIRTLRFYCHQFCQWGCDWAYW